MKVKREGVSRQRSGEIARTGNLLGAAALAISGNVDQSMAGTAPRSRAANASLAMLLQWPPDSIDHLAKTLRRSHSATVRLIEELQAHGLVTKQTGVDRRSTIVELTREGKREATAILTSRGRVLGNAIADLTPAELRELARILDKILKSLTPDREACNHICRLCSLAACPQERCPVELTALGHEK